MKYYYRSPGQLREDREAAAQKRSKTRNRTLWIIVADLAIVVLVFIVLQRSGAIEKQRVESQQTIAADGLQLSLALNLERADEGAAGLYLSARNPGATSIRFPAERANQLQLTATLFDKEGRRFTMQQTEAAREIAAGETAIYRLELGAPGAAAIDARAELRAQTGPRIWTITAP